MCWGEAQSRKFRLQRNKSHGGRGAALAALWNKVRPQAASPSHSWGASRTRCDRPVPNTPSASAHTSGAGRRRALIGDGGTPPASPLHGPRRALRWEGRRAGTVKAAPGRPDVQFYAHVRPGQLRGTLQGRTV